MRGAIFSMTTVALCAIVQVIGLTFVLQHLQNAGLIEGPTWVPYIDRSRYVQRFCDKHGNPMQVGLCDMNCTVVPA